MCPNDDNKIEDARTELRSYCSNATQYLQVLATGYDRRGNHSKAENVRNLVKVISQAHSSASKKAA